MKFEIKNRFTGEAMFSCELTAEIAGQSYSLQLGFAVRQAISARANLADANLAGANLADANLADAYLADANLADAYLAGAYLAGAYLADANLADANLADAYLAGAYLAGANLADAYLAGANLADAYLAGANLADAKNAPPTDGPPPDPAAVAAARAEHMRRYRERHPEVPVVEGLDGKILEAVTVGGGELDMSSWHTCETTHCRAGWAITLAGKPGADLEEKHGSERAGAMIYRASTGRVPNFFATNKSAMEDIKRCAEGAAGA